MRKEVRVLLKISCSNIAMDGRITAHRQKMRCIKSNHITSPRPTKDNWWTVSLKRSLRGLSVTDSCWSTSYSKLCGRTRRLQWWKKPKGLFPYNIIPWPWWEMSYDRGKTGCRRAEGRQPERSTWTEELWDGKAPFVPWLGHAVIWWFVHQGCQDVYSDYTAIYNK